MKKNIINIFIFGISALACSKLVDTKEGLRKRNPNDPNNFLEKKYPDFSINPDVEYVGLEKIKGSVLIKNIKKELSKGYVDLDLEDQYLEPIEQVMWKFENFLSVNKISLTEGEKKSCEEWFNSQISNKNKRQKFSFYEPILNLCKLHTDPTLMRKYIANPSDPDLTKIYQRGVEFLEKLSAIDVDNIDIIAKTLLASSYFAEGKY